MESLSPLSLNLGERLARPGLLMRLPDSHCCFVEKDKELLESKLEVKIGENKVKKIDFSSNGLQAYVELEDEADIDRVLGSELKLSRTGQPLVAERFDLTEVWRPYLVVSGLEEWIEKDVVADHFKESANGAAIEFVDLQDNEAKIMFLNPQVALEFPSSTDLLGLTLGIEVRYSSPCEEKEMVLAVKGLPPLGKVPEGRLRGALVSHFTKHTGYKASECRIVDGVGYMTFEDQTALKAILSCPPSATFIGRTPLEVSAAPVSQMMGDEGERSEDLAAASHIRTYSSASESSVFSPSSSMDSRQLKKAFGREVSRESVDSQFEMNGSDLESLWSYQPQRSQNSSTSSDGGHGLPAPSSGMPRREIPSGILFTVPEQSTLDGGGFPSVSGRSYGGRTCSDMQIQDLDDPYNASYLAAHVSDSPTKVCIEDIPQCKRSTSLIRYYLQSLVFQDCEVKAYGKTFLATFHQPIAFQTLKEKSSSNTLDGFLLSFYSLDSSKKLLVTFEEPLPSSYTIKLHFESFTGRGSVDSNGVHLSPPKKAYVTFKDSQSVQTAIGDHECWLMDGRRILLEEYYDFMAEGVDKEEDTSVMQPLPPPAAPKFEWDPATTPIGVTKSDWAQSNLSELNDALAPLKACGSVEEDHSGTPSLKVEPLAGSEEMSDWNNQIKIVVHCFLSNFEEATELLPKYGREELLNCAESAAGGNLLFQVDEDVLTLAGKKDTVAEVMGLIRMKIAKLKAVISEDKPYPIRQVKYLKKFSEQMLNNINPPVVQFHLRVNLALVTVKGSEEGRTVFWKAIDDELCQVQEKDIVLEPEKFKLLESKRGADTIEAAVGLKMADIVYSLEETPTSHVLCILCPSRVPKDVLKAIKESLKKLVESKGMHFADPTKFRFCSDRKWKEMVDSMQTDMFVRIAVDDSTHSVIVTGERTVVEAVSTKLRGFLLEQTSVEEQLSIDVQHWNVMKSISGLGQELAAIKSAVHSEDVKIDWPQEKIIGLRNSINIVIKGDPTQVDKVKGDLEALEKKVCHTEEKLSNIPAAIQVVNSMEDKIRVLESQYGASIDVSVTCDDLESGRVHSGSADLVASKLCSATCRNEVRVSVYEGDFTKHNPVDVVIIFIPPNLSRQSDSNLCLLFAAGGADLRSDFNRRISQLFKQSAGDLFTCLPGKLQCSQLWCCFIPTWAANTKNEEFYLQECLRKALSKTRGYNTILFAPISSTPLNFPAKVFAENLISSIACTPTISSDLTVAVYVSEASHGREFTTQFEANSCRVSYSFVPAAKAISSSIGSFITLTKGSLLDQQADVYVNSTNTNLDLKTGTLSKMILDKCGEELQKKCSEYGVLKPEQVAVTEAEKLKAKSIYHVALPDYHPNHHTATRKFRGTVKAILRTARDNGVTSLAIPSLGVGNLHYPAQTSAKILFEEVIDFHARNPGTGMKYHFVIYDQPTHQDFSKEYALKMSSTVPQKRKSSKTDAGVTRLSVENSDISEEEVDVIVNTTSEEMQLNNSAVSKALLEKAGPILQQTCDQLVQSGLQLDCGQVVETKAFGRLKCKRIIHAHVPARSDALRLGIDHSSLIAGIVGECLKRAEALGMTSISFPAFGFGQGGYSVHEVAEPMLTACREFGRQGPSQIQIVKVVIYDQKLHKEFFDFFTTFFKVDLSAPMKIVNAIKSKLSPKGGYGQRFVELQDGAEMTSLQAPQTHLEPVKSELLLFDIYAPSADSCSHIATRLKEFVKEKCVVEEIEDPVFANLIDSDIADMKSIGTDLQVQVNVIPPIKKIEISGEMGRAKEAKIKIWEVINKIKLAQAELKFFQWQTESEDDIEQYSEEDSFMLERAKAKHIHALQLVIDSIEVVVDLDNMEERNKETGVVRKVVRVPSKPSLILPPTWEPQPVDADHNESTMHMFDVPQGSSEYQEALKNFLDTVGVPVTISSLKRVQNPTLYQKHTTLQDTFTKKYPKKRIDVKHLFHGSSEDSIKCIATQGFNRSLAADANAALYGMGVYFALKSSYSAQTKYAKSDKDGQQSMFICRVIIGEYTPGKKGMKMAPVLREGSTELFDTLVEKMDKPTIFVTMTDAQAYPEYLVTFKQEKKEAGKT